MKTASKLTLIVALTGALFATSTPVPAQEKITLRAADYLAPTHYITRFGVKNWIDNVSKMSNGRVEIRHFPSAVVSGGMHKLVKSGLSGINFGGANFSYTMGKQRWNSLAPDVQKIPTLARNVQPSMC